MLHDLRKMSHKILFTHNFNYFEKTHIGMEPNLVCEELILGVFDLQGILVIIFSYLGVTIVVEVAVIELHRYLFEVSSALWVCDIGSKFFEWLCRL